MSPPQDHAQEFETHRRALLGAAYRVLGTVQDSEDAVQDTWLRWRQVDLQNVDEPRAYLIRAVTHTALNTVRSRQRLREEYIGPWLPEPVSTDARVEPGRAAEVAEEVSLALLVVLESLSPLERAAFVLREVFTVPYAEVAEALDRSEPAARQLVSRARTHVRQRAPRYPIDAGTHRELTSTFLGVSQGTVPPEVIVSLLAPEVVLTTDGGGHAKAARRPIRGAAKVLRFIAGIMATPEVEGLAWSLEQVNGMAALVARRGLQVEAVMWLEVDAGLVTRIDVVLTPQKLGAVRAKAHD